jgi:hypothetical protein
MQVDINPNAEEQWQSWEGERFVETERLEMAYELHITRRDEWSSNDEPEIALDEWLRYLEGDPEFERTTSAQTSTTPVVEISGEFAKWVTANGECWFLHRNGEIVVSNPDESVITKMKVIASALHAHVQGDEGEAY